MSDDWQPGDLALCVSVTHPIIVGRATSFKIGAIYTVTQVGKPVANLNGERGLVFKECRPKRAGRGYPESCFRKIRPHTPDVEDAETIALLTGKPATVDA